VVLKCVGLLLLPLKNNHFKALSRSTSVMSVIHRPTLTADDWHCQLSFLSTLLAVVSVTEYDGQQCQPSMLDCVLHALASTHWRSLLELTVTSTFR